MSDPTEPLPALEAVPETASALERNESVIVVAPPGTGKSTALPSALLDRVGGRILVTQPRRLAARMLATRVAGIRGTPIGGEVGFATRAERREGPKTRLCYLTEGLLLRRLLGDGGPRPDDLVVLDEFHERSIDADLLFGLLRARQARMLVTSATLDSTALQGCIDARVIEIESRLHPVTITHRRAPSADPLWDLAAVAVREVLADQEDSGDILVFMPGRFEIDRTVEACRRVAPSCQVVPLHGGLPPAAQDAAVATDGPRRIVVATNIAETSITIPRVTTVIDSGRARVARFDRDRDLDRLVTEPIDRSSATQRAGRAGRVRPGRCVRLYTESEFLRRPTHGEPAMVREDLSAPFLRLMAAGFEPRTFPWLDLPSPEATTHARSVLASIDAVRGDVVTEDGRRIASMPVPPRVGRFLLEASRRGGGRLAASCGAVLGERDIAQNLPAATLRGLLKAGDPRSDLIARARLLLGGVRRSSGRDGGALADAGRAARDLGRIIGDDAEGDPAAIGPALLAAFPDRIAHRRDSTRDECTLPGRRNVVLSRTSMVRDAGFLVAASIRGAENRGRGTTIIDFATPLSESFVVGVLGDRLGREVGFAFDRDRGLVEKVTARTLDGIRIDESRASVSSEDRAAAADCMLDAIERGDASIPGWTDEVEAFIARVEHVATWFPDKGISPFQPDDLQVLRAEIVGGRHRLADLPGPGRTLEIVRSGLDWSTLEFVDRMAPIRLSLGGGRSVGLTWRRGEPPRGSARIGDLLGIESTPAVAGGRVPIVLEILAPNRRPVQVTDDLAGFWTNAYPEIRKELRRRYPKHPWP
jgi:ATP-dependent helicase HrpB